MATTVTQDIISTYVPGVRAELKYTIREAADEEAAHVALAAACPDPYESIPRKIIQIETEHFNSDDTSENIFRGTVYYYFNSYSLSSVVSFDTTGGTQRLTQANATTSYPAGAPDFQGAINYDGDKINGIDIGIGSFQFQEQHYKSTTQCNEAYRITLSNMSYKVNDDTFRGFAAGEVLFKGATAQQAVIDGSTKWQITYNFACSPNRANFYVGSILVAAKKGWQYLWTLYAESESNNRVVQIPEAVYVQTIYDEADFDDLEI